MIPAKVPKMVFLKESVEIWSLLAGVGADRKHVFPARDRRCAPSAEHDIA